MTTRKFLSGLAFVLALSVSAPAFAHEDHDRQAVARAQAAAPAGAVPQGSMMAVPGMAQDMDHGAMMAEEGPRSVPQRLYRWLGAMHPAAVHFPIALFLVAALLEIAALTLRRPVLTQGTRVIIALAAISAVAAVALGWFAMGLPGKDDVTHAYHRWLGTSIAALGLLSWWAKEHWVRRPGRGRELIYIGLLSVTAAAVVVNGLLGGMLTHGMRHLMF
ncbi:MAG: hypothetical protein PSV23_15615 [Brevundimonas sp.]|uniref:DUF2231 domain-containing protein n=1 Tax=Brevundimonas sp. TaxID=1871086 RepID=UPI00248A85EF|nr:DUF2231 domain-containing protein [Brevundimonas sp.]MDI1328220.1 hypothetical protein [Brevundimonas sp.]